MVNGRFTGVGLSKYIIDKKTDFTNARSIVNGDVAKNGKLIAGTSSQRSATYSYQPFNRLTATSTASYVYDNNGNLTARTEAWERRSLRGILKTV